MMLSRIHNKLGTAGLVVAVVALVVALTGVAFAAGGLTKQQEKQVKKIAKKFAGKRGPQGPKGDTGATGAAGAKGDAGAAGAAGKDGTNGTNGTNGTSGESVTLGTATTAECPSEGVTVQVGSKTATKKKICNGETGYTDTLPSEKTETGNYKVESGGLVDISFNIPLTEAPEDVIVLEEGEGETTDCPGTVEVPDAAPGKLCLYTVVGEAPFEPEFNTGFPESVNVAGAVLQFVEGLRFGTWAVTAK